MNVIFILIDSLNRHCIGLYGNKLVKTPNLDMFAKTAAVFDNHFIGSAPCIPARRELMTGRKEFFWRGWGPLEPFDKHIAVEVKKAGAVTAIITDHYHYWEQSAHGYFESFDGVKMIRGHEFDNWNTNNITDDLPDWVKAVEKWRPGEGTRYYRNVKGFRKEKDFFAPRVMCEAAEWLKKNHNHEKFFLWIESFDVHEPFHIPEPYRSMYTDNVNSGYTCWPPYQNGYHGHYHEFWSQVTEEELEFIRGQYYGKITMTDRWLGKLIEELDRYNLWDNTVVIISSDHGHELGEKKRFAKSSPHFDLSAHIPLMIRHPALKKQKRINAFTTIVDIYPTILDILGGDKTLSKHGRSLIPLITGEADIHREAVVYGTFGCGATITNNKYTYHASWDENASLFQYTAMMNRPSSDAIAGKFIPDVDCPVWKIPHKNRVPYPELLFDRMDDPGQDHDISCFNQSVVKQMKELLINLMELEGVPMEQFVRLKLK